MKQNRHAGTRSRAKGTVFILMAALFSLAGFFRASPVYAGSSACKAGASCIFLPIVGDEVSNDLILNSVEITQAVQDAQNSVPLVAGRPAVMRIYATVSGVSESLQGVRISISAARAGFQAEGSPNVFNAAIPLVNSHADYSSTINFPLPENWLTGAYDLTIKLDPGNAIREKREDNNSLSVQLNFNEVPDLNMMIVPILYTHSADGHTYPAPAVDTISDWIARIYPVSKIAVTWHAPYAFSGDLRTASDFNRLLNEVTTLKTSEGAPENQVYYGLVPTQDSYRSWFYGGIAGIGWIGSRASVGVEYSGNTAQIAGHEIGHNLGMLHTPCGVTGDPSYPYAGGSIGQFGLDLISSSVYDPSRSKDMMSYCTPRWVSDYTYKFLFDAQMATKQPVPAQVAASAGTGRMMVVRATIAGGQASLQPTYILPGLAAGSVEKSEVTIQVLGDQGEVIAEWPVRAYQVEDGGASQETPVFGINAAIPLTDRPAARIRLMKNGEVLAEQQIHAAATRMTVNVASEPAAEGFNLRWEGSGQPVLLRYSADGGKTWTTLAADVQSEQVYLPASMLSTVSPDGIFDVIPANAWQ